MLRGQLSRGDAYPGLEHESISHSGVPTAHPERTQEADSEGMRGTCPVPLPFRRLLPVSSLQVSVCVVHHCRHRGCRVRDPTKSPALGSAHPTGGRDRQQATNEKTRVCAGKKQVENSSPAGSPRWPSPVKRTDSPRQGRAAAQVGCAVHARAEAGPVRRIQPQLLWPRFVVTTYTKLAL